MADVRDIKFEHEKTIVVGRKDASCISPYQVVPVTEGDRLYVTMMHSGNVAVLDRASLMLKNVIELPECGTSLWAEADLEPKSKNIFIAAHNQGRLYVINTGTDEARLLEGDWTAPGQVLSDGKGGVWLAHGGAGEIVKLNGETCEATSRIGVDPWPIALDIDHKTGLAFIACQHENLSRAQMLVDPVDFPDGTLCTADLNTGRVVDRLQLGRRPSGVAFDSDQGIAFVSEMADNYIAAIDTRENKLIGRVNVKCSPYGIKYDPVTKMIYTLCIYGDYFDTEGQPSPVAVIDPKKLEVVRYLNPGKMAHQLTVDGKRGVVYVGAEDTCDVRAIDIESGKTVSTTSMFGFTVDGLEPFPEINRMFIPSHFTESCLVVDTENGKLIGDLQCGGWISGAVVNRSTGKVYVNNAEDGDVSVFDARTLKPITRVNCNVGLNLVHRMWNGIAADEKRNRVYVYLSRRNAVTAIDGDRDRIIGRTYLGNLHPPEPDRLASSFFFRVAVNQDSGRVYVVDPIDLLLYVVDGEKLELIDKVDLSSLELPVVRPGDDPNRRVFNHQYNLSVDTSGKKIYVWNAIIDEKTLEIEGQLPIDSCTGVTTVDEKGGRLFCHGIRGLTVFDSKSLDELGNIPINPGKDVKKELRTVWMAEPEKSRVYQVREIMNHGNWMEVYGFK